MTGVKNEDAITGAYNTAATVTSGIGRYRSPPGRPARMRSWATTITEVDATLVVGKAPLTVTAADQSREYGEANPELTGTVTGVKNDDKIGGTYATNATEASPVGSYAIVAGATGDALGNYDVKARRREGCGGQRPTRGQGCRLVQGLR